MFSGWLSKSDRVRSRTIARVRRQARRRGTPRKLGVEGLEGRLLLTAVQMSDSEQLVLELVNRARANPSAEASRYGISLNEGLAAGTISSAAKQPLAPSQALVNAAGAHSQDMLNRDFFSHDNPDGKDPGDRIQAAGYVASTWGENIAWQGSTSSVDLRSVVYDLHASLFKSPGHRKNILKTEFREVGPGARSGVFTSSGRNWNAGMLTENFGNRAGNAFLTGVAFSDTVVADQFYSIGEGLGGVTVTAQAASNGAQYMTTTGPSGGYALQVPAGTYTITAEGGSLASPLVFNSVSIGAENVKVDFRSGTSPAAALVVSADALTVLEGGTKQFTVSLSARPASSVAVTLAKQPGSDPDLSLSTSSLTFTTGNWNQPQAVTVRAALDADQLDGTAEVLISAPGLPEQLLALTEDDTTTPDLVVQPPAGQSSNSLLVRRSLDDLQVINNGTRKVLVQQSLASVQSLTILGLAGKADTVTFDFAAGGRFVIPQGVRFDGGSGRSADKLIVRGTADADLFAVRAGRIDAAVGAETLRIEFTAIESVRVEGLGGNDVYRVSGFGAPVTLSDSAGVDTLDFSDVAGGIVVNLDKQQGEWQQAVPGSAKLGLAGTFEDVVGSNFADVIRGNAAANRLWGRGGDDTLYGSSGDDRLYGEAGRDRLFGDSGNDVLVGGDDDDELNAGTGKNLLIGGAGPDRLKGSTGEEILIGGETVYDADDDALLALLAEWTSRASWSTRIDHLTNGGGLNGARVLGRDLTLCDDLDSDTLWGGSGSDWFLDCTLDVVQDRGGSDR